MKFSIITPNFNGDAYLEQTIASVLGQRTCVDLEYILVDGGSTDGSRDIIEQYRDQFAHCIIEADKGPAHAVNKGFDRATGDIVAWLKNNEGWVGDEIKLQIQFREIGMTQCANKYCMISNII